MLFTGAIKMYKNEKKKATFPSMLQKREHLPCAINKNTTSPWVIIKLKYFHLLINREEKKSYSNQKAEQLHIICVW